MYVIYKSLKAYPVLILLFPRPINKQQEYANLYALYNLLQKIWFPLIFLFKKTPNFFVYRKKKKREKSSAVANNKRAKPLEIDEVEKGRLLCVM